jgi:hypothetical protein
MNEEGLKVKDVIKLCGAQLKHITRDICYYHFCAVVHVG